MHSTRFVPSSTTPVSDSFTAFSNAIIVTAALFAVIYLLSVFFSSWALQPGDMFYSTQQMLAAATSDFVGLAGPGAATLLVIAVLALSKIE